MKTILKKGLFYMRKMINSATGAIKFWSKEQVYSVHRYYTLYIECSTFYWADGHITKEYSGYVYRGDEFKCATRTYSDMFSLIRDFNNLLGW